MDVEEIARLCASLSISEIDGPTCRVEGEVKRLGCSDVNYCLVGKVLSCKKVNQEAFRGVYNIPLMCMNRGMAKLIAEQIGEVVEILGESKECRGRFLKVKVQIDISRSLKRVVRLDVDEERGTASKDSSGSDQGKGRNNASFEAKAVNDGILATGLDKESSRRFEIVGNSGNFESLGGTKPVGGDQQSMGVIERDRSLVYMGPNILKGPEAQAMNNGGPISWVDGLVLSELGKGVLVIENGPRLEEGVIMEGIELNGEDLADGPSGVGMKMSEELKLQKARKWKKAARAWSKTQVLGKVSSPIQKMLRATQKLSKSPKRRISPGHKSSGNSVNSFAGDGDTDGSKGEAISGKCGKRKGNFVTLEDISEAKKRKGSSVVDTIFRSAEPGSQACLVQ
ncbi:hypothetical protein ACOSP7_002246 [Xanthoceras sorbifolium]